MNWDVIDGVFCGIKPDGSTTHNEDEFYDAWGDEYLEFNICKEAWL